MVHLLVASESVDQTLNPISWLTAAEGENQVPINGDDATIPDHLKFIVGALFGAPTIDSARIVAPSLYGQFPGGGPDFSPLNVGAEPISPLPFHDLRRYPIQLNAGDALQAHIANSGAGSAEDAWAGIWLNNGPVQPVDGPWRTYKFTTAASALTAEDWNVRSLTSAQTLNGTYQCGGGFVVSTSGRLFRLSFPNQATKPGGVCGDTESDVLAPEIFRRGGMGAWGSFKSNALPSIEIFADAADNEVQEVYLDLIRTGDL